MKGISRTAIVSTGMLLLSARLASAAVLIPIVPVPGGTNTFAIGINDNDTIVGNYYTGGIEHAFFGTLDGQYTTFDYGATFTDARAINNSNYIIGNADDQGAVDIAFERKPDGSFKTITINGQAFLYNVAQGINAKGVFVGSGYDQNSQWHSYYGKNGAYTSELTIPQTSHADPKGINDLNAVVGFYADAGGLIHSFLLQNGVSSVVDYPNASATGTFLASINDKGMAAGSWMDTKYRQHAFLFNSVANTFIPIKIPNAKFSQGWGINKAGAVAVSSDQGAFIYCLKAKSCPSSGVEVPDPTPIHGPSSR
jgi:hypothetical protein